MNEVENIITIHKRDIRQANEAFFDFMSKSEEELNTRSKKDPNFYKKLSPSEMEMVSEKLLKDVSHNTPFSEDDIKLVSGHSFPDIMTSKFYGVEVKTTKENKWTSVGSSIVETTRNPTVENIYMLFGNLGADPVPQFKLKPYQDCLCEINVTHSPRYLIDMSLQEKNMPTIFEKLEVPYDKFRNEENKIDIVRSYYIKKCIAKNKKEMPWWVGKKTLEYTEAREIPTVRLFNDLDTEEKNNLKAQMLILFPQVIKGDYSEAALWLCTHRYYLCMNIRDFFSAGGQYSHLNGERLRHPLPAVVKKIQDVILWVKSNLKYNDDLEYIEFNEELGKADDKFEKWLKQIKKIFDELNYFIDDKRIKFKDQEIEITDCLRDPQKYRFSR